LFLSSCGIYTTTEPTNRSTLKVSVTRCDLGGSVEIVVDGNAGPYPMLSTPGEITMALGPGAHTLTYRRDGREFGANITGDPFDLLRTLAPRETAVINAVDPPWACVTASGARSSGLR
jgi:hypothetical protein